MFFRAKAKKKKKIEQAQLIEAKFLSGIYGGQGKNLPTAIEAESTPPIFIMTIGVGGTHQPPP